MMADRDLRPAVLSFLGIDGIGKSTLAQELKLRIEKASGRDCEVISRRSYLGVAADGFVKDSVLAAYAASLRSLYGRARLADGSELGDRFPSRDQDLLERDFEKMLSTCEIVRNDPDALIATAIGEIAAHLVFDRLVLRAAIHDGRFVLQETHGIKSIMKALLLAEELLGPGDPRRIQVAQVQELAIQALRPAAGDASVFIDGDARRALRQRMAQAGGIGGWEHYGIATGDRSPDSYLRLQHNCRAPFAQIANAWGSATIDRDDTRFGTIDGASDRLWSLVRSQLRSGA